MENKKISILLIGAPGSGKSTWGKQYVESRPNFVRLCPDEFRAILGAGEDDQSVSAEAFAATKSAMRNVLESGKSVMIDATNMYKKTRKDFLNIAHSCGSSTMAIVFESTKSILIERNRLRGLSGGRNVPEFVIDSMLSKYQPPDNTEFDIIQYITKI